jgi:hypothetical protein
MISYTWTQSFKSIYDKAFKLYQQGNRELATYFTDDEIAFLASIGARPMEVYDFVEDYPEIDWETALLITAARRAHFLYVDGAPTFDYTLSLDEFPAKEAEMDGIPWLPRVIMKANARLTGQLPNELMYCCGGDRAFFQKFDIHPADFLRLVWYAGEDHGRIIEALKNLVPNP